jgi:leucine dehydrogenase
MPNPIESLWSHGSDTHERVLFVSDADTGLKAIIAVHNSVLGPAAGGCRMWPYPDVESALFDVLRLSKAMTWKNALAGLPLGGGKSVIIGDPQTRKTPELLAAFARAVNDLGGRYLTAEDVGVGADDVEVLAQHSRHVFGLSGEGQSGDPSPYTARGVFEGMRAALVYVYGSPDFSGRTVAVQGIGNVGLALCSQLHQAGAKLIVADRDDARTRMAVEKFGASVATTDDIHCQDADIYAPCAMGGALDVARVNALRTPIICGAANNQLADPETEQRVVERDILYAPDFVVNAGGMLNAAWDALGGYDRERSLSLIAGLFDTTLEIFKLAKAGGRSTNAVAEEMARARINAARR